MRSLIIFATVTLLTFGLMFAAIVLALPVAFETQGVGWPAAPVRSLLVAVGNLLQAPLVWAYAGDDDGAEFGAAAAAMLSALYGASAAGTHALLSRIGRASP